MHHFFLASRNAHKTREFAQILGAEFTLQDLRIHPEIGEVTENGATFAENARLKAVAISRQVPGLVLADDSGLEVDSFGGAPGIYSARYAGEGATDETNRQKLLEALARLPQVPRGPRVFVAFWRWPGREKCSRTFEGAVEGQIIDDARGDRWLWLRSPLPA